VYAYCVGVFSSRKIQRRLLEDVAFRVLAAGYAPDSRTIADFRKTHPAVERDLRAGARREQDQRGRVEAQGDELWTASRDVMKCRTGRWAVCARRPRRLFIQRSSLWPPHVRS
jgi:hypothetical protein